MTNVSVILNINKSNQEIEAKTKVNENKEDIGFVGKMINNVGLAYNWLFGKNTP